MMKVLVSACLLGQRVRYHGGDARCGEAWLARWCEEGRVVPFCPEVAGGLPVPRPPAEIERGNGVAVLGGRARVLTREGVDVSAHFLEGARQAASLAVREGIRMAVLKEGSPSCGSSQVYDGSFSGARRPGPGVTTALLEQAGVRVFSEHQLAEAAAFLAALPDEA
jgi:uncharacterized protein YbbK (DUF523 family)